MPYNPWAGYRITGTWADHMSYSLGGEDLPLSYGTPLKAPASGTLRTGGGSGEFAAGWIGTAGRRSILTLDRPIGDMVAIVFQHQSAFGVNGRHYNEGEVCGWSGASASGRNYGGDVHLHVHGLRANGTRVQFTKYVSGGTALTATSNLKPVELKPEEVIMYTVRVDGRVFYIAPEFLMYETNPAGADLVKNITATDDRYIEIPGGQWGAVLAAFGVPSNVPGVLVSGPTRVWSRAREVDDRTKVILDKLNAKA